MKHALILIAILPTVVLGCTKSQVKDSLIEAAYSNQPTVVTILSMNPGDKDFAECVQRELANNISALEFIAEDIFRDSLFPWFEYGSVPRSLEDLDLTINQPLVLARLQSMGIRFAIFVGGHGVKGEFSGPFYCGYALGGGGGGCVGYMSALRKTEITAVIWDLARMVSLGDLHVETSGTFKWIGFYLPIPIPCFTKGTACSETAKTISDCIVGKGRLTDQSEMIGQPKREKKL